MLSYKLYKTLTDIIDYTYPESEYPENKFKKFYLEVIPKEMKTIHGRYYIQTKKIEIFNLSRPTGHIVATSIHEVAHHIDCCFRNNSDHTIEFYTIMQKLLITALGMGVITVEDIITASDSKDRDRLVKHFGTIESWDIKNFDYKIDTVTVKVKNCYPIKDKLAARGYKYSGIEQSWIKDINVNEANDEKEFLSKIIDLSNVDFSSGNEIDIQAVYYILVFNSYEHREYLKSQGYLWNGYNLKKNSWNKKILASEKESELEKIAILPGVEVKIISKK